ncbi:MAG: hypothetical protein P8177_13410 [Gemmatimonadota bacterium]|jgi:hypothetical protein
MSTDEAGTYANPRRLIAAMQRDGVPLEEAAVMEEVEHPHWERARGHRDWRAHVPRSLREAWGSLPLGTRLCVFETAELTALEEHQGAVMITGPAGRRDTG